MMHPLVDHDQYLPQVLHELLVHAQLHPSKPSASYKQRHWYMRLSFLKYNFQMAWTMQWLHAILNYMKKVKLSILMVPPNHPSNKGLLSKGWSVTMRLGIYRDLFMHAHAVSGAHYMYIHHQAVDVWNWAKYHWYARLHLLHIIAYNHCMIWAI